VSEPHHEYLIVRRELDIREDSYSTNEDSEETPQYHSWANTLYHHGFLLGLKGPDVALAILINGTTATGRDDKR